MAAAIDMLHSNKTECIHLLMLSVTTYLLQHDIYVSHGSWCLCNVPAVPLQLA